MKPNLMLKSQACQRELVKEAGIADAFEDARPERAMDFHRGADDDPARFIRAHISPCLCVLGVLGVESAPKQAMGHN